jgi:hypothetical protein
VSEPNKQYHQALSANRKLLAENARLKAEVERLTKAIDLTIIDLDERHERQDLRAWEFAELLRKAKGVQS